MLAGVRRVGADRHDQRQHGGEGRRAQHQPAGLRGHRPHQGARRAGLLRRRLLRGHSRLRRQGQRRAGELSLPTNLTASHLGAHCKAAIFLDTKLRLALVRRSGDGGGRPASVLVGLTFFKPDMII
jgi:hypothetical protein